MNDNQDKRYCDRFNMTPQEFQNYRESKYTRIIWYIIGMIISTLFNDRWCGYLVLTFLLILSYYDDYKQEEQWIKDGSMTKDDLR